MPALTVWAPFSHVSVSVKAKSFVGEMRAMLAEFQPAKPVMEPKGIESS